MNNRKLLLLLLSMKISWQKHMFKVSLENAANQHRRTGRLTIAQFLLKTIILLRCVRWNMRRFGRMHNYHGGGIRCTSAYVVR